MALNRSDFLGDGVLDARDNLSSNSLLCSMDSSVDHHTDYEKKKSLPLSSQTVTMRSRTRQRMHTTKTLDHVHLF